jgi:peptide/nickel transport system ATP-binding protein
VEENILELRNISVEFKLKRGVLRAVDDASLSVRKGEILGIVGESGSGKSTLASTILNIVSSPGVISGGQVLYNGIDVLGMSPRELRDFRWKHVAMVFQAAQNSMNPILKIKDLMLETAAAHAKGKVSESEVLKKAAKLLDYVRLDPKRVLESYPHQLSGGMKQRTIIALSLLLSPDMIILDEPTTALDVITQAYIMDILQQIHAELGITMIFLSHDVSVVGKVADRMAVMYAGNVVEVGQVEDIFYTPSHPYTEGLILAAPSLVDDVAYRRAIAGSPPDMMNPPAGCRFSPRCGHHKAGVCPGTVQEKLQRVRSASGHYATCLIKERIDA